MSPAEGRALFGEHARGYERARPEYPDAIFASLLELGALREGMLTLDVGAGTGLATRRLLELGARVTALEPDTRFNEVLGKLGAPIVNEPLEAVEFDDAAFDLIVVATALHWLDPDTRAARLARLLKPEGHLAIFANVFQDPDKDDPFHEATKHVLEHLPESPSTPMDQAPFALDADARIAEFVASGDFELVEHAVERWTLTLDTHTAGLLYRSFSPIARRGEAERVEILSRLMEIADRRFNGIVERNLTSPLYLFKRL